MPDSVNPEQINYPGEVNFNHATLTTMEGRVIDITTQIASISLFESMTEPFISGYIMMSDGHDLINTLPIVGQEFLLINFNTPGLSGGRGDYIKTFCIYKISDVEWRKDNASTYRIHFISPEAIINMSRKMTSYMEGAGHEIIDSIVHDEFDGLSSDKALFYEETNIRHNFTANYWQPMRGIEYVVNHSQSENGYPYLFFENKNGFVYLPLDKLYETPAIRLFKKDSFNRDANWRRNTSETIRRIMDIYHSEGVNYPRNVNESLHGSRRVQFDLLTREYTTRDYNIFDDEKNLIKMNTHLPIKNKGFYFQEASQQGKVRIRKVYEKELNDNFNFYQKTNTMLSLFKSNPLTVEVVGSFDLVAGAKVGIELPLAAALNKGDQNYINEKISGDYLIAALNHTIGAGDRIHKTTMTLMNDTTNLDPVQGAGRE